MSTVAKVWIEEDCITCDACQDILPEVFEVTDDTSQIKAEVREDGSFDYGQLRYYFNDTALNSLQEAAESFLENMWEQLRDISDNDITIQHIQTWKRDTGFKIRVKNNNLSLCKLFTN